MLVATRASCAAALALVFALAASAASAAGQCAPGAAQLDALLPPRFYDGRILASEDLQREFDGWLSGMEAQHPALSVRTDMAGYARARADIRATLTRPMSEREAALTFARLNPVLRDAHNTILLGGYRAKAQAYLDSGGRIFPLDVRYAPDGALRAVSSAERVTEGTKLRSINGRTVEEITQAMLAIAPGETLRFRRAWVARRFPVLHWLLYGDTGRYVVGVEDGSSCGRQVVLEGGRSLPLGARTDAPASLLYSREVLVGGVGYLRADSFGGEHREAFADFARQAFAEFRRQGIRALIIDVRENPGGDDPLWQESLMEHITTTPYAQVSRYVVRITARNADPGDVIGAIQRSEYKRRYTSSANNPDRFSGPVYILAGPYTYSAAIQFVVAAQDFGIAKIAGEETGALSCQTGQTSGIAMGADLNAVAPVIAFTRPSGVGCDRGVLPDVMIPIDETRPRAAVEALAATIRKTAPR